MSGWSALSKTLRARIIAGDEPQWLRIHIRRAYVIQCALATPPWLKRGDLRRLDEIAKEITRRTGKRHVADHIIPITHPYVCGLNVPWNLQVIPYQSNAAKSNRWSDDQMEMFTEPEQFSLLKF
jgi:5-methylcytosine-specific restriction endonuclease McrA